MGTLEEQTKVLNASAKLKSDLRVLADRQTAARTRFKAALGLGRDEPDPNLAKCTFPVHTATQAKIRSGNRRWRQIPAWRHAGHG